MDENYILAKWLNDELPENELADFKKTSEYNEYEKIKHFSSLLKVGDLDEAKLLRNVLNTKKQEVKVVSIKRNLFFKIAAIVVIGFGLSFFMYQNFSTQTELAMNGRKTSFSLPDNSEVVLNSGSEIQYKRWNWNNNRNVNLKGEAYFHVAKGKKFEVQTNLGKVAVLGTQFDVKSRKNRFDITCFEGRVKVNYNEKEVILTQGMKVTFENGIQTSTTTFITKPDWLSNSILFENESLENIKDEIERQYNINIELKTNGSKELFSGKIPTDNIETALEIITTTYKLKLKKISETKMIFEE